MLEFIDGPCGWDRLAPARLRRCVGGDVSAWRNYSTSRFLDDLDPIVLDTVGNSDSPFDSGVLVELLPEVIARRWRNLGIEFATRADMDDMGFTDTLGESLGLVRSVLPLDGTVAGLCRSLHVLVASGKDLDVSCSDPTLPFSIFVSCPPAMERNRVERLAESIVHEALHLQLSLVETAEPLIIDTPDEEHVFSPWKNEWRTVRGLLHGVYVFGNLRCFWKAIATTLTGHSSFAQTRIEEIDSELAASKDLVDNRSLTATGRRLARSFLVR